MKAPMAAVSSLTERPAAVPVDQVSRVPTGTELHGQEFELLVRRLGDGPAWVHLDVHTDAVEAE
jgi:hypothetical protein